MRVRRDHNSSPTDRFIPQDTVIDRYPDLTLLVVEEVESTGVSNAVALLGCELVAVGGFALLVLNDKTVVSPMTATEAALLRPLIAPFDLAAAIGVDDLESSLSGVELAVRHVLLCILVALLLLTLSVELLHFQPPVSSMSDAVALAEDMLGAAIFSAALVLNGDSLLPGVQNAETRVALALLFTAILLASGHFEHPVDLDVRLTEHPVHHRLFTPLMTANLLLRNLRQSFLASMSDAVALLRHVLDAPLLLAFAVIWVNPKFTNMRHAMSLFLGPTSTPHHFALLARAENDIVSLSMKLAVAFLLCELLTTVDFANAGCTRSVETSNTSVCTAVALFVSLLVAELLSATLAINYHSIFLCMQDTIATLADKLVAVLLLASTSTAVCNAEIHGARCTLGTFRILTLAAASVSRTIAALQASLGASVLFALRIIHRTYLLVVAR